MTTVRIHPMSSSCITSPSSSYVTAIYHSNQQYFIDILVTRASNADFIQTTHALIKFILTECAVARSSLFYSLRAIIYITYLLTEVNWHSSPATTQSLLTLKNNKKLLFTVNALQTFLTHLLTYLSRSTQPSIPRGR